MIGSYLDEWNIVTITVRLILAVVCGGAIGLTRSVKRRGAGFKTHALVCLGSALVMMTGQYIYVDFGAISDIARLAAQVISGVGFLGVGTIMVTRDNHVKGLTTAAGVWVTAAIGLSIGSGLYFVGIAATVITILGQILLHGKIRFLSSPRTETLMLQIVDNADAIKLLQDIFEDNEIIILNLKSKRDEKSSLINVEVIIRVYESFNMTKFLNILQSKDFIKSLEF